jgi:hypothetical protein
VGDPPPALSGVPGGESVLAELVQQALLAGLCLQVVMPLAGELAGDAGGCEHGRLLLVPGVAG